MGKWLAAIVLTHLAVNLAHGQAHTGARVEITPAMTAFVVIVILIGPLAGLALSWRHVRAGAWLIAATMTASLVFGVVNHFLIISADHVTQVAAEWRTLFGSTAVALALLEAAGAALGTRIALARDLRRPS
jgi:hypothetical protein